MKYGFFLKGAVGVLFVGLGWACDKFSPEDFPPRTSRQEPVSYVTLEQVAQLLSAVPLEAQHVAEVRDAALSSAGNGYDEEYLMKMLFCAPGCGVGEEAPSKASRYDRPLRDLIRETALTYFSTKAGGPDAAAWLDSLSGSDIQIYWPSPQDWDGTSMPVITYDPGDGADRNEGYALLPDGTVRKVMVDEQMAREQAVWVVSRNSDAEYKTLEMLRREDPAWGSGGGELIVGGGATKAGDDDIQTLVLRSFKARRQFDSWFAGASEFFVKLGSVEDFYASTDAELRLYSPNITDFMIVVRRGQVGEELPFNAVLVSEWTSQLSTCAFMIIEDDGGTRTTWKCSAVVKYNSRSYGFEVEIPLNSRDDIVWRGALSHAYIEKYNGFPARFGDVELVLELI